MNTTTPNPVRLCPKCRANPLTGKSRWCNSCKAAGMVKTRKKKNSLIKQMMRALEKTNGKKK